MGNGSAELAALAKRLKIAGNGKALRTELLRGIRSGTAPLIAEVRAAALQSLPKTGGLNERVAKSPIKTQIRTSARNAGVRIIASEHDARSTNFGGVRHPVFGHQDRWVAQTLPDAARGWFLDTLEQKSPEVTSEITAAMERVAVRIQELGGL